MVLTSNHLVAGASSALATTELSAFVDWLVDAAEEVVLVLLRFFSIVVVGCSRVLLLRRGRRRGDYLVLDFINHLTALHASSSDFIHFCFGNGRTCHSLASIDSHELLSSHAFEIAGGDQISIRDVGVVFLNHKMSTNLCSSRVSRRRYCLLTRED